MPRLLAVGHVTRDTLRQGEALGGTATYAALAARKLGWEAAVLTAAGADFDPARELPGVAAFVARSQRTTRFLNVYEEDGDRSQVLSARASPIDLSVLPDDWRTPDALLLGPVAGEIEGPLTLSFEAGVVGAVAQGWLRAVDEEGRVSATAWADPVRALAGVHVLFLSEHDLPDAAEGARALLATVPVVALTRGWRGVVIHTRDGSQEVPGLPRPEVDPTGAGDVFAAAFLLRYHEAADVAEAAAFAVCAASCVVEGVGTAALGDRAEVERRRGLRERLVEEGEWDE